MAKKKIVEEEIKVEVQEEPKKKTINNLTDRQRELRYFILRLGVSYGNANLKEVIEVLSEELK